MNIVSVEVNKLKSAEYNPRKWSDQAIADLTESIKKFGLVDPIIVNSAPNRENIVIGGHFRMKIARDLGYKEVPVYYINLPDIEKEKELLFLKICAQIKFNEYKKDRSDNQRESRRLIRQNKISNTRTN